MKHGSISATVRSAKNSEIPSGRQDPTSIHLVPKKEATKLMAITFSKFLH